MGYMRDLYMLKVWIRQIPMLENKVASFTFGKDNVYEKSYLLQNRHGQRSFVHDSLYALSV